MPATAVAIVCLLVSWLSNRADADQPLIKVDLDTGGEFSYPTISPDGLSLVFVTNNQLAMRRLNEASITRLPGTEGASVPFYSPEGESVAFFANGKLKRLDVNRGAAVTLCDAPVGRGGSWGPDGQITASLNYAGGLYRVPVAGGAPLPITVVKGEPPGVTSHRWPQVLPRTAGLLFTAMASLGKRRRLAGVAAAWRSENIGAARLEWPLRRQIAEHAMAREQTGGEPPAPDDEAGGTDRAGSDQ